MKLIDTRLIVSKSGYARDGDHLDALIEEAERIVDHYIAAMTEELDQAGYTLTEQRKPR